MRRATAAPTMPAVSATPTYLRPLMGTSQRTRHYVTLCRSKGNAVARRIRDILGRARAAPAISTRMTAYSEEQVRDLARRAYRGGTASFAIDRARSALLIVDMQDEFVRPGWTPFWVPEATKLVPRLQKA